MMIYRQTILALAGLSVFVLPLAAQDEVDAGMVIPENWTYDTLYDASSWRVDDLFGQDVTGSDGTRIGNVEDLVMNDAGEVIALIAEVGGVWDIGDTHVSVPWDKVSFSEQGSISVPVTEDNMPEFDLFTTSGLVSGPDLADEVVRGADDQDLSSGLWRASELIGDYVRVRGDAASWINFGYVSDLIIQDGAIAATLVTTTAARGPGTYAYPFPGLATPDAVGKWTPREPSYDLPVLVGDAMDVPLFDVNRI